MRGELPTHCAARPDGLRTALRQLSRLLAASALILLAACSPSPKTPPAPSLSVLSWNLDHFGPADRDGDGQANNPKPEAEVAAILDAIAEMRPDVLVLQEMGNAALLEGFKQRLAEQNTPYPHGTLAEAEDADRFLALLSRLPLHEVRVHTEDRYSIAGTACGVKRGFIEALVEPAPGQRVRLFAAHLRSRSFHPLGQTEMRRNEARLLAQHLRRARREFPGEPLVLAGTLNDLPGSSIVRDLMGTGEEALIDLRPTDAYSDAWTAGDAALDLYERLDYLLATEGPSLRADRSRLLHSPALRAASRHRALHAVFILRPAP